MTSEEVLHIGYNNDLSLLATTSEKGYQIYQTNPFSLLQSYPQENYKIIEIYENSDIILLVGAGSSPAYSPRILVVKNLIENCVVCEISFPDSILCVKMNRFRIIVATINEIYIYDTITMRNIKTITTSNNPKGIIALSPNHADSFLLYPGSEQKGYLFIYDCFSIQPGISVEAHRFPLAAISISFNGKVFATASTKGTIIRVFSLPEGERLFKFKRGLSYATIYNMMFSFDSKFLLVCSSTGTVHVFKLFYESLSSSWSSSIKTSAITAAGAFLPSSVKDSLESCRSFISAKTDFVSKFIALLIPYSDTILVVSYNNSFNIFRMNKETGGKALKENFGALNFSITK